MRALTYTILATAMVTAAEGSQVPRGPRTLALVVAHADDEGPVAPILARYAREGVRIYEIIASDGSQGAGFQGNIPRPEPGAAGEDLVRQRAEEARCSAQALGLEPPILLDFPDGKLGDYIGDRSLLYRLTDRLQQELQRLQPDVILTWGPDGGIGHPDHRLVSNIVTQLQRAGAPGVPQRVFYMYLPVEGIRAMSPRGAPPFMIPQPRYFTTHVPFSSADLEASKRAMACHRSQFTPEVVERVMAAAARELNGQIALVPAFDTKPGTDLFE
jgi:LmbE family N-acetylglucosaminyl deacetylase